MLKKEIPWKSFKLERQAEGAKPKPVLPQFDFFEMVMHLGKRAEEEARVRGMGGGDGGGQAP